MTDDISAICSSLDDCLHGAGGARGFGDDDGIVSGEDVRNEPSGVLS